MGLSSFGRLGAMNDQQRIAELERRLDKLETKQLADMQNSLLNLRSKFDMSGYLRTTAMPRLGGDINHLAGTEPVGVTDGVSVQKINVYDENNNLIGTRPGVKLIGATLADNAGLDAVDAEVASDRWEYRHPTMGGNGRVTFTVSSSGTHTVLSKTETGKLIDVGCVCENSTAGGSSWTMTLQITIDGGTTQNVALISGGAIDQDLKPHCDTNDLKVLNDKFVMPFNLEYKTSILIQVVVSGSLPTVGDYRFGARRGVLV